MTPLTWTLTGFPAMSINNVNPNGTATFTAGTTGGLVVLTLTDKNGKFATIKLWVTPPTGTRMTRFDNNVYHWQGFASAGIEQWYWLSPTDVSFHNVTLGEDTCPATNVTGFFQSFSPWINVAVLPPPPGTITNNYPNGGPPPAHQQGTIGAISTGNATFGCYAISPDYAFTGGANPYAAGTYTWSIPTQWIDSSSTRHTFGTPQNQVSAYDAAGTATVTKGSQPGSARLNDPSSGY